jgi:undecaprenyl-phosphate galactose phosphotransferase
MNAAAMDCCLERRPSHWPAEAVVKRALDIAGALALLALCAPVMILIAILVRRDGGAALFGHGRMGADGRSFKCWKFRSMVPDAGKLLAHLLATDPQARAEWEREYKLRNDPRITPLGRFLRTSSLDELPQLFNVLRGEMSLVGPRPIVRDEVARYGAAFADYCRCRPGITGKWQVSGRNDVDYPTRVSLDREYVARWSLGGDILILLRTIKVVLRREGAC